LRLLVDDADIAATMAIMLRASRLRYATPLRAMLLFAAVTYYASAPAHARYAIRYSYVARHAAMRMRYSYDDIVALYDAYIDARYLLPAAATPLIFAIIEMLATRVYAVDIIAYLLRHMLLLLPLLLRALCCCVRHASDTRWYAI